MKLHHISSHIPTALKTALNTSVFAKHKVLLSIVLQSGCMLPSLVSEWIVISLPAARLNPFMRKQEILVSSRYHILSWSEVPRFFSHLRLSVSRKFLGCISFKLYNVFLQPGGYLFYSSGLRSFRYDSETADGSSYASIHLDLFPGLRVMVNCEASGKHFFGILLVLWVSEKKPGVVLLCCFHCILSWLLLKLWENGHLIIFYLPKLSCHYCHTWILFKCFTLCFYNV